MKRIFLRLPWSVSESDIEDYLNSRKPYYYNYMQRRGVALNDDTYKKIRSIARFLGIAKSSVLFFVTIDTYLDKIEKLETENDEQKKIINEINEVMIKKDNAINELIQKLNELDKKHKADLKAKEDLENFLKKYKSGLKRYFYKYKNK